LGLCEGFEMKGRVIGGWGGRRIGAWGAGRVEGGGGEMGCGQ